MSRADRRKRIPDPRTAPSTPPTPDCFLNGITRQTVTSWRGRGLRGHQRHITPDELPTFSEVFITGSAAEVTPVAEMAGHTYKPGNITGSLADDYRPARPRQTVDRSHQGESSVATTPPRSAPPGRAACPYQPACRRDAAVSGRFSYLE